MTAKRILLVEDEYLVGLDIQSILTDAGFDVSEPAMNIGAALDLIKNNKFDAAVLDVNLGGQSSEEIAARLTDLRIPFILLTGYGRENLPPEVVDATVVEKPFDEQKLIETIRNLSLA
ncbi:MAG: response regulator [Balneolales bacterium]